ncbi:hypothetical protein F5141DRAFT_1204863 [Pisolithus sp. B1]|nr:hypothetical protein F5141DRAFT_1204863 [Pisolithus sp. B1]
MAVFGYNKDSTQVQPVTLPTSSFKLRREAEPLRKLSQSVTKWTAVVHARTTCARVSECLAIHRLRAMSYTAARTYAAKEKRRNVIEDCIFARGLQIRSLFQQASLSVVSNDETSSAFTRGNSNDTLGDFIRVPWRREFTISRPRMKYDVRAGLVYRSRQRVMIKPGRGGKFTNWIVRVAGVPPNAKWMVPFPFMMVQAEAADSSSSQLQASRAPSRYSLGFLASVIPHVSPTYFPPPPDPLPTSLCTIIGCFSCTFFLSVKSNGIRLRHVIQQPCNTLLALVSRSAMTERRVRDGLMGCLDGADDRGTDVVETHWLETQPTVGNNQMDAAKEMVEGLFTLERLGSNTSSSDTSEGHGQDCPSTADVGTLYKKEKIGELARLWLNFGSGKSSSAKKALRFVPAIQVIRQPPTDVTTAANTDSVMPSETSTQAYVGPSNFRFQHRTESLYKLPRYPEHGVQPPEVKPM